MDAAPPQTARRTALAVAVAGALTLPGCFLASEPFSLPAPEDAEALESAVRSDSTDLEAIIGLAALLLNEGQAEAAAPLMERTYERVPEDPAIPIILGMIEEELGAYSSARDRYEIYLQSHAGTLAETALERLYAVEPAALRGDARRLLASQDDAGTTDARRVAVLPPAHPGDADSELVAVAVSELVARDLEAALRTDAFSVVSPRFVRILIEEMGIEPMQRRDLAVAARVGTLLGAGKVVQVDMADGGWDVSVTSVGAGGDVGTPVTGSVRENGPVQSEIVLAGILPNLVDPGPAQRNLSTSGFRPGPSSVLGPVHTTDEQALLAFARGLLAGDRGEADGAAAELEAVALADTAFAEARILSDRARVVLALSSLSRVAALEEVARVGQRQRAVVALRGAPNSRQQRVVGTVGTHARSVVSEALGLDRVGGSVVLDVIFTVPGAGP